jgi:hypothetical protein
MSVADWRRIEANLTRDQAGYFSHLTLEQRAAFADYVQCQQPGCTDFERLRVLLVGWRLFTQVGAATPEHVPTERSMWAAATRIVLAFVLVIVIVFILWIEVRP